MENFRSAPRIGATIEPMRKPAELPPEMGRSFTVQRALSAGVTAGRLRRSDVEIPFRGVRWVPEVPPTPTPSGPVVVPRATKPDPFEVQARERRVQARRYAPRLKDDQYLSHESAVALLGGPLPLAAEKGIAVDGSMLPVHVTTNGTGPLVRAIGVTAHRSDPSTTRVLRRGTLAFASPETAWAQLSHWDVEDLVALGDHFCRVWRPGVGRPDVGKAPMTTIDTLRATIAARRRTGIRNLREAVELIREDSWSPRESKLRVRIVRAGLPEPLLNQDVFDDHGRFLGCVDLAYPHLKVAIEYQGTLHSGSYAADVERIAALRAAGWIVIEVTSELFARPEALIERIRQALSR